MKLLLALVLCGVTCCFAQPRCNPDDMMKCEKMMNSFSPVTENELNQLCRAFDCKLNVWERCMMEHEKKIRDYTRNTRDLLCDKISPVREKYLENAQCLVKTLPIANNNCQLEVSWMTKEERCVQLPKSIKCVSDEITKTCNEVSSVLFEILYVFPDRSDC